MVLSPGSPISDDSLSLLTNLETLLFDEPPERTTYNCLSLLTNLTKLDIADLDVSYALPNLDFLSCLSKLVSLDIDVAPPFSLPNVLSLSVGEPLSNYEDWVQLTRLVVEEEDPITADILLKFTNLHSLSINPVRKSTARSIGLLTNLTSLCFFDRFFDDIPLSLPLLKKLVIYERCPSTLQYLTQLEKLDFVDCSPSPGQISPLTNLTSLEDLEVEDITSDDLPVSLIRLGIKDDSASAHHTLVLSHLTNLTDLTIAYPHVSPEGISNLTKLVTLEVYSNNEIDAEIIRKLTNLEDLTVCTSEIPDYCIQDLHKLTRLLRMRGPRTTPGRFDIDEDILSPSALVAQFNNY